MPIVADALHDRRRLDSFPTYEIKLGAVSWQVLNSEEMPLSISVSATTCKGDICLYASNAADLGDHDLQTKIPFDAPFRQFANEPVYYWLSDLYLKIIWPMIYFVHSEWMEPCTVVAFCSKNPITGRAWKSFRNLCSL